MPTPDVVLDSECFLVEASNFDIVATTSTFRYDIPWSKTYYNVGSAVVTGPIVTAIGVWDLTADIDMQTSVTVGVNSFFTGDLIDHGDYIGNDNPSYGAVRRTMTLTGLDFMTLAFGVYIQVVVATAATVHVHQARMFGRRLI